MQLERKADCPLFKEPCRQLRCEWFIHIAGKHPQTGVDVDEWDCAVKWQVLGLIEVESAFRKYAISSAGARGYMQVMPFWTRSIGDGNESVLFHTQTQLRFGCVILRHMLERESGDLYYALGRYNGSREQSAYPQAVLAAQKKWLQSVD
jgi:hypothetical protein